MTSFCHNPRWACNHHEELLAKRSCLEFKLHKLTFLDLLEQRRYKEALNYSKIFASFSEHADGQYILFCSYPTIF